jgi:hypothetical protein
MPPRTVTKRINDQDHEGIRATMDVQTIDQSYRQLESQSQQTIAALSNLSQKLQGAVQGGDPNAREWQLDLREIALGLQQEQNQVTSLLQAIHDFVATQAQQPAYQPPAPSYPTQPPPYPAQSQGQQLYQQGAGGALHNFLGGGFGQAIVRGAGFGIGDDLINHLFR